MNRNLCVGALGLLAAAATSASAQELPSIMITITASTGVDAHTWSGVATGQWSANGTIDYTRSNWNLRDPDSGVVVAHINEVTMHYDADPVVNLFFSVQAGLANTTFTISSALLSFPGINPAIGRATAGMTLTDSDGDGASLTASADPVMAGGMYRAATNGYAGTYNGTTFATFFPGYAVVAWASSTVSDVLGFIPVPGTVNDMSSMFTFTLSANDQASGTSSFVILPTPGAAALMGLAALSVSRRRR